MQPTSKKIGESLLIENTFVYRIIDIKTGGMGCVYMLERSSPSIDGEDRGRFGKWLAAKTFLVAADDADRFEKELNIWIDLTVPYLVPLLSITRLDGQLCAIMPLYACSLDDVLSSGATVSRPRALSLTLSVVQCLSEAYEKYGVLHLDLKPGNLLLKQPDSNIAYVGDWGIARIVDTPIAILRGRQWRPAITLDTSLAVGTLPYMSPERIVGLKPDPRDDIYSLGLILCQLLTGSFPLHGGTEIDLVAAILNGCTRTAEHLLQSEHPQLTRIVCWCIARHRDDRYQTYNKLLRDLKKVQNGLI